MDKRIRVLIVDDHLMVRKGLRLMLEEEGEDMEPVGEAADGEEALALIEETQPDVVLMDIRMPKLDGILTLQRIRASWPLMAVLLLTTYDDDDLIMRGLQAGAHGYLLKDTSGSTLLNAIRSAARGEILVRPEILARVLSHTTPTAHASAGAIALTRREREVLLGLAQGERRKEIALRLHISERTVRAYLTNLYTKLNVDSRTAAVAAAYELGLLTRQG
jgi:NarL family two-component system response regulator YdfI